MHNTTQLKIKHPDAVRFIRSVGGIAFPNDYNWECSKGHICRHFELTCYVCQVDKEQING